VRDLPLGPKSAKLGPELLGCPHDQRLELWRRSGALAAWPADLDHQLAWISMTLGSLGQVGIPRRGLRQFGDARPVRNDLGTVLP